MSEVAALEQRLASLATRKHVSITLTTSSEPVDPIRISERLDKLYEQQPTTRTYPKPDFLGNILRHMPEFLGGAPPDETLHVTILTEPAFIGLRYGYTIRPRALSSGLMFGKPTLDAQLQAQRGDVKGALDSVLAAIDQTFPAPADVSWYHWFVANQLGVEVHATIEEITTNHWEAYNKFLLDPVLTMKAQAARASGWPVAAALVTVTVSLVVVKAFLDIPKFGPASGVLADRIYIIVVCGLIEAAYGLPAIGSLFLLSSGRLEDRIFASSLLDVPTQAMAFIPLDLFTAQTGFWLAIPLALLPAANLLFSMAWLDPASRLPEEVQDELMNRRGAIDSALFAIGTYHQDADTRGTAYEKAASAIPHTVLGFYGGRVLLYSILPLGAACYFAFGGLATLVVKGAGYRKEYKAYSEILAQLQASAPPISDR